MEEFLNRKEASKMLNVHYHTLYKLAEKKEIETIKKGDRQYYNVKKYLKEKGIIENIYVIVEYLVKNKKKIYYGKLNI